MLYRIFVAAMLAAAPAAAQVSVEIVLDGSDAVVDPSQGAGLRAEIREAVVAAVTTSGAVETELEIGLRTAGGGSDDGDPCSATHLVIEPAAVDTELWATVLGAIEPQGPRPLNHAVAQAVEDLGGREGARRVVVVTAGGDGCDADPQEVAKALAAASGPVRLHIVGLALDQAAMDGFGNLPLVNATDSNSLLKAIRSAILEISEENAPEPTPTPIPIELTAPERAAAGQSVELGWFGPELDEDFVSLARPDDPGESYLAWARVEDGGPATLRAPADPGEYELRYVDGTTGKVLARSPLVVEAVSVVIDLPKTATAGLRFTVTWTGPAADGDFLAIAQPDAPAHRTLDWASTTVGSPATLAAPADPGIYEVRYVAAGGREIIARRRIEVVP